jgi:DNA polymerase-3 subunit beta
VLTGISVELNGDKMILAAADGFRLAVHTATLLEPVSEPLTVLIPGRTLQEVERLVEGQQSPVEMVITPQKSQVLFKMENIEMVSQLIQGTFPNYSQLIPQGHTTRAVVGLQDLLRTTKTAAIFAKDGSGIIRVQVVPGSGNDASKLIISARAEEVGDNTGDLAAEVEGEEGKIAFNSKYLADVLSVLDKDQVAVEMTTSSSPGVIRPVGVDNYIHVVMPMFVQW